MWCLTPAADSAASRLRVDVADSAAPRLHLRTAASWNLRPSVESVIAAAVVSQDCDLGLYDGYDAVPYVSLVRTALEEVGWFVRARGMCQTAERSTSTPESNVRLAVGQRHSTAANLDALLNAGFPDPISAVSVAVRVTVTVFAASTVFVAAYGRATM
jgi:hypothetical protein